MTEFEAHQKYCPMGVTHIDSYIRCEASLCMAWRWSMKIDLSPGETIGKVLPPAEGYCGLAGKPYNAR